MPVISVGTLFPPPKFLRMEGGGLEISENSIKYFNLQVDSGNPRRIGCWGIETMPEGVVVNGEVKDEPRLAEVLRAVRKLCGFSLAHVSLLERQGYLFTLQVPRAAEDDLAGAISLRLSDYVPLPASEIIFDCETAGGEQDEENFSVAVTAFPKNQAGLYERVLIAAGFMPLSMELEPQAALRAILPRGGRESGRETVLLVDFGEHKASLCVCSSGVAHFSAMLEGSRSLDAELAKRVGAEKISQNKLEEGLASADASLRELFEKGVRALCEEAKGHITYWNTKVASGEVRAGAVESIVLHGGNANIRGLAEKLSRDTNLPCRVADVWEGLRFSLGDAVPPIPRADSLRYATVLGLALRSRAGFI